MKKPVMAIDMSRTATVLDFAARLSEVFQLSREPDPFIPFFAML